MRRIVVIALALSTALFLPSPATVKAGTTWTVKAGASAANQADQALRFLPKEITINEGDTVQWKIAASDHTIYFTGGGKPPELIIPGKTKGELVWNPDVFFPSPKKTYDGTGPISGGVISSGTPGMPKVYSLTFARAGTYKYVCMFHPGMEGTVTVQAAGSAYPKTQAQYDQEGADEAKVSLAEAKALHESAKPEVSGAPGKRTFTLNLVGSMKDGATFYRFPVDHLAINRGDTVTWVMKDPTELHTVTFGGRKGLDIVTVKPQKGGPPLLEVTKETVMPLGGKVHKGSGLYNSGFLLTEGPGVRSYSLTFSKSGTYEYICAVHAPFGMKATITVR